LENTSKELKNRMKNDDNVLNNLTIKEKDNINKDLEELEKFFKKRRYSRKKILIKKFQK